MANVVEVAIRGIDEATRVFEQVGSTAQKSMEQAESSVNAVDESIDNVSDLEVGTGGTEQSMQNASESVRGVEDAIEQTEQTGKTFGENMKGVFNKVAEKWKEITAVAGTTGAAMEGFARKQGDTNRIIARTAIATGESEESLRDLADSMADATTSSAENAEGMELLTQMGYGTREQFENLVPAVNDLAGATGKDFSDAVQTADGLLAPFGQNLDDLGDNTDQLSRIIAQTDIPLGSLQRNLGRVPDELKGLEFGLDDAAAGVQVFRDRGFESRESIREFRRAVEKSEGNMDDFLERIGLTNEEWEEYQKQVEPATDLTQDLADANDSQITTMEKISQTVGNVMTKYGGLAEAAGMLAPVLIALGPVMKGVQMATALFNATLWANPITWIVAGIVALIAVIVLLWKNWDEVSQFLAESWEWIKETATVVFEALGEFFGEFWEWLKNLIIETWNSIKEFFVETWDSIKEIFMTVVTAIGEWLSEAWNTITETVKAVWNGIKDFFGLIWDGIVAVITAYINQVKANIETVFNVIKTIITTIWNAIKAVSSTVWNAIVSVVTGIINGFKSGIQATFNTIKAVITTVWNAIKSVSTSIWNGIKGAVSGVINGLKSTVSSSFNSIKSTITSVWNGIKSTTSSVWNSMVGIVKAPINLIISAINGMINGINSIRIKSPKIPSWVPKFGGKSFDIGFNIPNIPSLATGGVVSEPTLAMVGDAGRGNPEIVAPQKMIAQIVAEELKKVLGNLTGGYRVFNQQPQPLVLHVRLGRSEFTTFVEDITKEQDRNEHKLEKYR